VKPLQTKVNPVRQSTAPRRVRKPHHLETLHEGPEVPGIEKEIRKCASIRLFLVRQRSKLRLD
jgi:hypothetical protein